MQEINKNKIFEELDVTDYYNTYFDEFNNLIKRLY